MEKSDVPSDLFLAKNIGWPARRAPSVHLIAKIAKIESGKKRLAPAEEYWTKSDVHFVYEARLEILPDRRRPAADADVFIAGRGFRLLERGMDPVGHKMKVRYRPSSRSFPVGDASAQRSRH